MHMSSKRALIAAALVLVAITALSLPWLVGAQSDGTTPADRRIAALEAELRNPQLKPDLRASLEEKLQMAQAERQAIADGRARQPDPSAVARAKAELDAESTRVALTPQPRKPGTPAGDGRIQPSCSCGFGSTDFLVTNLWEQGEDQNHLLTVFAGVDGQNRTAGVVVIRDDRGPAPMGARLVAPGPVGRLTIVGAVGHIVEMRAADGTSFAVDAEKRSFVTP